MAFVAALVVVRPFLTYVTRSGFAPFAWYRIAARGGDSGGVGSGLVVIQWLRSRFLAGFFITVPLVISVAALYLDFRYH